jgi:hypothetical protein
MFDDGKILTALSINNFSWIITTTFEACFMNILKDA